MTDSQGRIVSFKNSIIILTSNLGSNMILDLTSSTEEVEEAGRGAMKEMVMTAVRSHFRPEFINRIDEFIIFDPLKLEQIERIVRLQVN